ncbi:MAG: tRNA (adenosine(37)-N6)-threonylcarbamoyltransferase complex ATPase subunit type 1 TsaE [Bacteroidia bacterium]
MPLHFISHKELDNEEIAKQILAEFPDTRIFLMVGDLGAGKTTFTKSFCKALGVNTVVTSPTFSLVNEYKGKDCLIYHFDFYRIKTEEEVYDMGYEEYFYSGNYCFIEWSEKIPNLIPEGALLITFHPTGENIREITIKP